MSTAGMNPERPRESRPRPQTDIDLTGPEENALITGIRGSFVDPNAAEALLRQIDFPNDQMPNFQSDVTAAWNSVFRDLRSGIVALPYRRLLAEALRTYPYHPALRPLAERHGIVEPGTAQPPEETAPEHEAETSSGAGSGAGTDAESERAAPRRSFVGNRQNSFRVIVRATTAEESTAAREALERTGLGPRAIIETAYVVGFQLDVAGLDTNARVREALGTDFGWTLISPDEPDYLLETLYFRGPDGGRYVGRDIPAAQRIVDLASDLLGEHYTGSAADAAHSITVDHIRAGREGTTRVNPLQSMHDAGVRDQDTLVVARGRDAGSVNPDDHEDALYRARNQITAFVETRGDVTAKQNDPVLPTEYELSFRQPSFGGPPPDEDTAPPVIEHHAVLLQLGPDFPRTAPQVWWATPIFHPNVTPNYDDAAVRDNPYGAGLVCLGLLKEGWQPAWDLAELCQMIIDIAAFRSVSTKARDYVNPDARNWVVKHEETIRELLRGWPSVYLSNRSENTFRNVIEKL